MLRRRKHANHRRESFGRTIGNDGIDGQRRQHAVVGTRGVRKEGGAVIASRRRDSVTAAAKRPGTRRIENGTAAPDGRVRPDLTLRPHWEHRSSWIDVNLPLAGGA